MFSIHLTWSHNIITLIKKAQQYLTCPRSCVMVFEYVWTFLILWNKEMVMFRFLRASEF